MGSARLEQLAAWGLPGWSSYLLWWLLAPLMAAALPIAFATVPDDHTTILQVGAATDLVLAPMAVLWGAIAWMLAVLPMLLAARIVVRLIFRRPTTCDDLAAVAFSVLLVGVLAFATSMALGAPTTSAEDTHHLHILAFFGFDQGSVVHPALLWTARASIALVILAGVVLTHARSAGTDPA